MLIVLLGTTAQAEDCRALNKALSAAAPMDAAASFTALAKCDAGLAGKAAPKAVARFLGDDAGFEAAVYAVEVGADESVRTWVSGLQSDEKARAIAALGDACASSEKVQAFFVDSHATLADGFWTDRWYRGLDTCRVPGVQQVLTDEVNNGVGNDRSRFVGVLEAYSRNLAGDALATLQKLGSESTDPEVLSYIVTAFADAAQVGSKDGMNGEIAQQASGMLAELAVDWPTKAIEQARLTLGTLGDEQAADGLAAVRFKDVVQDDGSVLWGAVVVEDATCKKGKTQQAIHTAMVTDPGRTWPDQLEDKVKMAADHGWELGLAKRCKGEGATKVMVPHGPFTGEEAYEAWVGETVGKLEEQDVDKRMSFDHDPIQL